MASQVNLKALGLNYSPNNLALPEGSLVVANDVIVRRDNVIESRRGFREYSETFGNPITDHSAQIISYKDRILNHYYDSFLNKAILQYDTGTVDSNGKAIFENFNTGSDDFKEVQTGLRIKSIESNKNLYFTTSEGIKKISARTASDFTPGMVKNAGAVKAIDFAVELSVIQGQQTGFLGVDSAVAYRIIWGYKDLNDNLILGSPSDSISVYNYLSNLCALDTNALCLALDKLVQSTSTYHSVIHNVLTNSVGETFPLSFSDTFNTKISDSAEIKRTNVVNIATNLDRFSVLANTATNTLTKPLQIGLYEIANGLGKVYFNNYTFTVTSANATNGDIYKDSNNQEFTVTSKLTAGTTLVTSGQYTPATPTGNLTKVSGTGDATIAYSAFTNTSIDATTVFTVGDLIEIVNPTGVNPTTAIDVKVFNNYNNVNNTNPYWTITSISSNYIEFSFGTTTVVPGVATASTAVSTENYIYPYTYRNIVKTVQIDISSSTTTTFQYPLATVPIGENPTNDIYANIQSNIYAIIVRLKSELSNFISKDLQTLYLLTLNVTTAADVKLTINIPSSIKYSKDYFVQAYRTANFIAGIGQTLGTDVVPDDEMNLVYEAFPITSEYENLSLTFIDDYPTDLRTANTPLYTNPTTGEGINQSNDIPPIAKDVNRFKNTLFYANTKTRHRLTPFTLLGTSNIYDGDKFIISDGTQAGTTEYTFKLGVAEETTFTFSTHTIASDVQGKYFTLNSANDEHQYYIWYRVNNTNGTDPAIVNKIGCVVDILTTDADYIADSAKYITDKTINTLNGLSLDFNTIIGSTVYKFVVTNIKEGFCENADSGNILTLSASITNNGDGENASLNQILLSQVSSRAQAIDITARSIVTVINKNVNSPVNAYYISSSTSLPGIINLESKSLINIPFYVMANTTGVGNSFNPNISPANSADQVSSNYITNISIGNPTTITTNGNHGLVTGDEIIISDSSISNVSGIYSITKISNNTFQIPVNVTTTYLLGHKTTWSKLADTIVSTNESKPNRIYYSKLLQPEAVPILNYFDVGSADKQILRIFPLRDSLFVFKEDGLYRISGETAPFVVTLFDSSCVLIAADSVSVANNIIYSWTNKGISNITEAGVNEISRPIDTVILKLASANYVNFPTITWGVGYDSDNSYTVYTNSSVDDKYATIAFRYSNLTNTWTNFVRSQTCGVVNLKDDKIYTGSGLYNLIDQERKDFARTDYSDRDFTIDVADYSILNNGTTLKLNDIDSIKAGDVIIQEQLLSTYDYNSLLNKLDFDPAIGSCTFNTNSIGSSVITITTSLNHNLIAGNWITLKNTNTYPVIDGDYQILSVPASNQLVIKIVSNLVIGTTGAINTLKRNYTKTLGISTGVNLRTSIVKLANFLDTDPILTSTSYFNSISNKSGSISLISATNPSEITTTIAHGLKTGRIVTISGTTTNPNLNNTYPITYVDSTNFSVPVSVISGETSPAGTFDTAGNLERFEDITACFNIIVEMLNDLNSGTAFKDYKTITETKLFEAVVLDVNKTLNTITLNLPLELVVGYMEVYKSIPCSIQYAPVTFGDPLQLKQIYEATLMFNNKAFTKGTAAFSSDLKPEFFEIDFYGQGNGIFGHYSNPGFGFGFFGGGSNSAPFRTIIPRESQRCRFINVRFSHSTARELWSLYGITLSGNVGESIRAYR